LTLELSLCVLRGERAFPVLFFAFILNVTDRERDLARRLERRCADCGKPTPHRLFLAYRQLTLFFFPLWRWNRRYFVECEVCGQVEFVPPREAQ
jgi:hypothetical protein